MAPPVGSRTGRTAGPRYPTPQVLVSAMRTGGVVGPGLDQGEGPMTLAGKPRVATRGILALMIGIAIIASTMAGTRYVIERDLRRAARRGTYRIRAQENATRAVIEDASMEMTDDPGMRQWYGQMSRYYRMLERKYAVAALDPGQEIPADPPPPPLGVQTSQRKGL